MASIHAHGEGFRVHFVREGVRRKSPSQPSRAAAEAWIAQHLPAQIDDSLLALTDLWRREEPSPHRTDAAHRVAAVIADRGWHRPERLTANDLLAWVRADPAWRRPCQYLRTILRWAARVHRIAIRPEVLAWRPPRVARSAKPALLTDAQAELIRDAAAALGSRAFAVIDYLMTYGARPITACRLRLAAIDVERGDLVLGLRDAVTGRSGEKHSGGWRHRLYDHHLDGWPAIWYEGDPAEVPIFPHYLEDRPWRIVRGSAAELASWYVNRIGRPLGDKLGGLIGIYHLKRYAITRMFRAGIDPATIALFTGHLDTNQLMTYAVSNAEVQQVALDRLTSFSSHEGSQVPTKTT
jgi:hypothetical protein